MWNQDKGMASVAPLKMPGDETAPQIAYAVESTSGAEGHSVLFLRSRCGIGIDNQNNRQNMITIEGVGE